MLGGAAAGVIFGVALGCFRYSLPRWLKESVPGSIIFEFLRFPPPIAWLPFVVLAVGVGPLSSVLVVFLAVFPLIATHTYEGLSRIPLATWRFARSLELPRTQLLRAVYLPSLLPQLFTGVRLGLGLGWMSVIAAEMVGGQSGLGYSIQLHRIYMQYDLMLMDIFTIGFIGFLFHYLLTRMETRFVPWAGKGGSL